MCFFIGLIMGIYMGAICMAIIQINKIRNINGDEENFMQINEDELFLKIGYEKVLTYSYILEYRRGNEHICFDFRTKEFYKYEECKISDTFIYSKVSIQELEIIEKIVNKLGW